MKKKKLLLMIDNLQRGGAELLLVGLLPQLNQKFEVILVTLSNECDFTEQEIPCAKKYNLHFHKKSFLLFSAWKLKKIIKKHQPVLIHTHLFYSSLIARIASPLNIPLLYSLHGEMSKNVFNNSKLLTFLEKLTIKKNHSVIAVSNTVLKDYQNVITAHCRSFVLKNYISEKFFNKKIFQRDFSNLKELKLVAIGNIKKTKNYAFLLAAFEHLKDYPVSLEIYGNGDFATFKKQIDENNLRITFKSSIDNPEEILSQSDLFVSCSIHEGFGVAAVEAIASGLPLLLSDLPVFHEVTFDNALFFDAGDPMSFATLIKEIFEKKYNLNRLSMEGIEIAKQYNKERYLKNLYSIYDEVLK